VIPAEIHGSDKYYCACKIENAVAVPLVRSSYTILADHATVKLSAHNHDIVLDLAIPIIRYLDVSAGGVVIGGMMHEKLIDEVRVGQYCGTKAVSIMPRTRT